MQLRSFSQGVRFVSNAGFLVTSMFVTACRDNPVAPVPAIQGVVTVSATGAPVSGAKVTVGGVSATTGSDGRFVLSGVIAGAAKIRGEATGFEAFEADITVPDGPVTHNIALKRIELFQLTDFSLYVPESVAQIRGVLVALGGPDTRGFAAGSSFGAPVPQAEAALQTLGQQLRAMAASKGLAIIGTSKAAMSNDVVSDNNILQAIQQLSSMSGRDDLKGAPFLIYSISGGGPEAAGFAVRNAPRVAAVLMKTPVSVESIASPPPPIQDGFGPGAIGIPTYIILEELDVFVNNTNVKATYQSNRAAGAPWALATELGGTHFTLSPAQRDLIVNWMSTILSMRLGSAPTDALKEINESSGWLGNPSTGEVMAYGTFNGNPRTLSWFPSQSTAEEWRAFVLTGRS